MPVIKVKDLAYGRLRSPDLDAIAGQVMRRIGR